MISGFIINSLPKSGTNLVDKAIRSIPDVSASNIHLGYFSFRGKEYIRKFHSFLRFQKIDQWIANLNASQTHPDPEEMLVRLGIVGNRFVDLDVLSDVVEYINQHGFATAHIPYSKLVGNLFQKYHIKMLVVMRDPRDVVVSQTFYLKQQVNHFLFAEYQQMSFNEAITASIVGHKNISSSIRERIELLQPWLQDDKNQLVVFENIIGPEGGGSQQLQDLEVRKILDYLGIDLNTKSRESIVRNLFGGTSTFRSGQTGSWKKVFDENNKKIFKENCGDILIKFGYEMDFDW